MPPSPKATARADRVSGALLLLFSLFVVVEARALPYWAANAPGPGFLPFWLGVLLACVSVWMFARPAPLAPFPDRATTTRVATVVAFTAAAAVLSLVAGLALASGAFMGVTLAYLRPTHTRANWIAALLTPVVVWLLFVRWLAVPLPAGPFGY
jgi:putative tricarboxylic transport membrane protein